MAAFNAQAGLSKASDEDVWKCIYCLNPAGSCKCEDSDFNDKEEGMKRDDSVVPTCPDCKSDQNVWCCECGERTNLCSCTDDTNTDWFCMSCQDMFYWDPFTEFLDDIDEDDDDVIEATDGTKFRLTADGVFWLGGEFDGKELACRCPQSKKFACASCRVRRDNETKAWSYWDLKKSPQSTTTYKSQSLATVKSTPTTTSTTKYPKISKTGGLAWDDDDDDDWYWQSTGYKVCRHYDREVKLKNVSVWASSLNDGWDGKRTTKPDFGLYADWSWKPYWRNEHIDWPDFGAPRHPLIAAEQIVSAYERIVKGQHVEVGCIGGHGRTGTILACLAVLDGHPVDDAVSFIRKTYCDQAVESGEQTWFVKWFHAFINDLDLPEKPTYVKKVHTTQGGVIVNGSVYCSMREHWDQWLAGQMECSLGDKCKYWEKDVAGFESGGTKFLGSSNTPKTGTGTYPPKESLRQPKEDTVVIDGFRIPKPARGVTHHGKHCESGGSKACDYCRYTALAGWGVGAAFLDPADPEDKGYINVAGPKGEIIRVAVPEPAPAKKPPKPTSHPSDEFEWDNVLGWQWKGQKAVKSTSKASKKKNKKQAKSGGYVNRR